MRELSIFTGAGGGLLATHHLLDFTQIGYVEYDKKCQETIAARIKDGLLYDAPIFGDIKLFISDGYARAYKGMVDIVTAGPPCQPFSVAGKRLGAADPRNRIPELLKCVRIIRPLYVFMENSPSLLTFRDYFGTILRELAEMGYDARWCVLGASDVGAPHHRKRLWLMAHAGQWDGRHERTIKAGDNAPGKWTADNYETCIPSGKSDVVADCESNRTRGISIFRAGSQNKNADLTGEGAGKSGDISDTDVSIRCEQCRAVSVSEKFSSSGCGGWWETEPDVGRLVDGMAPQLDVAKQIEQLGNGQVPLCAAYAFRLLANGFQKGA